MARVHIYMCSRVNKWANLIGLFWLNKWANSLGQSVGQLKNTIKIEVFVDFLVQHFPGWCKVLVLKIVLGQNYFCRKWWHFLRSAAKGARQKSDEKSYQNLTENEQIITKRWPKRKKWSSSSRRPPFATPGFSGQKKRPQLGPCKGYRLEPPRSPQVGANHEVQIVNWDTGILEAESA